MPKVRERLVMEEAQGSADSRNGYDQDGMWAAAETNPCGSLKTFNNWAC